MHTLRSLHTRRVVWNLHPHIPCSPLAKPALPCVSLHSWPRSIRDNAPSAAPVALYPVICFRSLLLLCLRLLLLLQLLGQLLLGLLVSHDWLRDRLLRLLLCVLLKKGNTSYGFQYDLKSSPKTRWARLLLFP